MRNKKEFSKCCKLCGVEWLKDFSNKYPKRALCKECQKIEYQKAKQRYIEKHKNEMRKVDKLQPFKFANRKEHWREVNKQIRGLKKVEDIHQFIKDRADEIFANRDLMDYINHNALK